MFTWEIRNFVNQRNGVVDRDEFLHIINKVDNPQLVDVEHVGTLFAIKSSDDKEDILVSVKK